MAATPREPRSRIVLAVILTAAIGGMFLAGEGREPAGVSVSSVPADQRVVQQESPPVPAAPSADEILTFTGRDPFLRDKEEKKSPPAARPAAPVALPAPGLTSVAVPVASAGGVAVSLPGAVSPRSGSGSSPTAPAIGGGQAEPRDDGDSTADEPDEPAAVDPAPISDGGDAISPEPDISLEPDEPTMAFPVSGEVTKANGKPAKANGKPAKPKSAGGPPFEGFQRTKEKPVKSRGLHKGWSQGRRGKSGYSAGRGWGRGNAWGWRARCDSSHPSSKASCGR